MSFGFTIVDAEGEADALCAKLSIKKRVFACMSDDTDMFVYGCPHVLRHISLLNHSVVCYNMSTILETLQLTQEEFKMLCIVNGTDYTTQININDAVAVVSPVGGSAACVVSATNENKDIESKLRIFKVYNLLMEFKRLSEKDRSKYEMGFYEWLEVKKNFISSVISLISNEAMFDISKAGSGDQYKQLVVLNRKDIHRRRIVEIMMKEDFIFIESNPDDHKIISTLSRGSGTITSSPIYGVGVWDDVPRSASNSSVSSCSCSSVTSSFESTKLAQIDAVMAVAAIDTNGGQSSNTVNSESQEYKALILATEVYGVDASSMHELNDKILKVSKPIKIKKKK